VPDPQPDPPRGWWLLPKSLRPGDEVWAYDGRARRWRWAQVRSIRWVPGVARYHVRLIGIRRAEYMGPRGRRWIWRPWRAWPVSHAVPPCPACHEPARVVGGTAMLRHLDGCAVDALTGVPMGNGHRGRGEEQ
jgi:hypothetical protein